MEFEELIFASDPFYRDHTLHSLWVYFLGEHIFLNADFLTLLDELEEFSRISRASQNRQYVDEFCRTALDCPDGWLAITFVFDRGDPAVIQPEFFFRGKAARFLSLFDVPRLAPEFRLKVVCADRLAGGRRDFELELSRGRAVLKVDGEARDPAGYLGSADFGGYSGPPAMGEGPGRPADAWRPKDDGQEVEG